MKDTWRHGWAKFPFDPQIAAWAKAAKLYADAVIADQKMQKLWLQCEGTWFVGVDALPNDPAGRLGDSVPLAGTAVDFIIQNFGRLPALLRGLWAVLPTMPEPGVRRQRRRCRGGAL